MKKTAKKVLSVILVLLIVASSVVSIGLNALAVTPEYIYTDGKRTGLKSVLMDDGIRYFDIADGGMLDDDQKVPEFYIHALTKEYEGASAVKTWATIASHIFEDAGHGSGYAVSDGVNDTMFDAFFTEKNPVYDGSMDLIDVLSKTEGIKEGSLDELVGSGLIESTGLTYFSSLEAVQKKMADLICIDGLSSYDSETFLEKATGSKTGFDIADDGNGKPVIASVASSVSTFGTSGCSAFALAFYDFELIPFVAEGVEFITAAEGYDTLDDASDAGAPGVKYNTSSTGEAFVSYTTNPSRASASTSISFSESNSVSVSNSMQSTKSHTYGHSVGVGVNLGLGFPKIGLKMGASMNYGFTTQDTISTAYSETKSLTESTSKTATAQISLPAHTKIGMSQQKTESEIVLDYDCPVYITYKVAVIGINGTNLISGLTPKIGSVCTVFGSSETVKGITATENLNKRAIQYADMPSFEESQYYHSSDDNKKGIDWKTIIDAKQKDTDKSVRECVNWICGNIPLSVAGATLTMKQNGVETRITDIKPLYNLKIVTAGSTTAYSLAKGGSIDLLDISTQGFNQYGVPYHGYLPLRGSWSVCDANGNPVTNEMGITIERTSYTQILTANEIGDYYVRFNIDEKTYTDVDEETKYITNADLSTYPIVKICVTNTGENHNCVAGDWVTTIPATCFMEGAQVKNCLTCGIQMETRILEKTEHTHMVVSSSASCTENGSVVTTCGVCGAAISSEEIEATGHDDGIWKVDFEATAEHDGQMSRYCTKCGGILETKAIVLHIHEKGYEKIINPATCTQYGEKGIFCKICDAMYATEQTEKTGHGETVAETSILPGCVTAGEEKLYCKDCGMLVGTKEIPANGHTDGVWLKSVAPTCTEAGEEILVCTDCETVIDSRAVKALGHDDGVWKVDFEATVDHDGQMSRYCSKCNEVLETKEITLHTHKLGYEEVIKSATCVVDGLKGKFCSVCGVCYETEAIPAKGHGKTFAVTTLKATCTENGEKTLFCSVCNEAVSTETVEPNGHSGETYVVSVNPTCTQAGEEILRCDSCGEIIGKKEIAATGHSAQWLTVEEATCSKYGKEEKTCTVCGTVLETRRTEKEAHIPGKWEITQPSSCTQSGLMQQACALCGALIGDPVVINPHDHQAGEWVTVSEPGCENEGEKVQSCTVCKGAIATQTIPALGHTEGTWIMFIEATCENKGEEHLVCTRCDHIIDKKGIAAVGHTFSEWHCANNGTHSRTCLNCMVVETNNCDYAKTAKASTCTEGGYTTYVCTVCNHTYISDYTDANGHNWSEWTECAEHCCHERECLTEGCYASETQDHSWGEWVYNEDGKCFKNGTKTRSCPVCGATETEEAQHTSTIDKIFYPVIVFFGNIVHKIIWIFSLNWLFPELTITPKI